MWRVIVVELATGKVVEKLPATSLSDAEKIERGVQINLAKEFGTDIEEVERMED